MHTKKFSFLIAVPLATPLLDIFPLSVGIVVAFIVVALFIKTIEFRSYSVSRRNIFALAAWFVFSCLSLLASYFLAHLNGSFVIDVNYLNYFLRFFLLVLISIFILVILGSSNKNFGIELYADSLFYIILVSAVFEGVCRALNLNDVLYFYKARQDLGGIDSIHYNRFSGFWSYPGDAAAIIALSFVLIINNKVNFFLVKIVILFFLLLLTQSKAGVILLLSYLAFHYYNLPSIRYLLVFLVLALSGYFAGDYFDLLYLAKGVDDFNYYLLESKRTLEVVGFFVSDFHQKLTGLHEPEAFYESELFGSFARVGVLGSFWLIAIIFIIFRRGLYSRKSEKNYWVYLFLFISLYCSFSAGISRIKILLPHILFFWLLMVSSLPSGKLMRNHETR